MFSVKIYADRDFCLSVDGPSLLSDILTKLGIRFDMPCGGKHTCGKCKARAFGALNAINEREKSYLSAAEIEQGVRLLCMAEALGDCAVFLDTEHGTVIEGLGELPKLHLNSIDSQAVGAAIDIGTTTIAAAAFHLQSGKPLSQVLEKNAQSFAGADVISRIDYCSKNETASLSTVIRKQLTGVLAKLAAESLVEGFTEIVITGNTTMLHILAELNPSSLAVFPFATQSLFGETISAAELGLYGSTSVYLPPCISAYVGADLVCTVAASGMTRSGETSLIADIGTNGEMALWHDGKHYCCSTAAGPAFEGAGISAGMNAMSGAIDKVGLSGGSIAYTVIGGEKPKGICGSGIVDAISSFLRLEQIDETGRVSSGEPLSIGDSGILITQEDVRKIQLAKSALCAGIYTLADAAKVNLADIQKLYLAGGFGNYLNIKNAARIGLIPPEFEHKVIYIGNAALSGAAAMLLDNSYRELKAETIEINLSESPYFMDKYIDCMMF